MSDIKDKSSSNEEIQPEVLFQTKDVTTPLDPKQLKKATYSE